MAFPPNGPGAGAMNGMGVGAGASNPMMMALGGLTGGAAPKMGGTTKAGGGKVSPDISGYMGPEAGPFMCSHCEHFQQPSSCDVVDGMIDPQGCCNLYTPGQDAGMGGPPEMGGGGSPMSIPM